MPVNPHLFIGLPVNEALKACALKWQRNLHGHLHYKRLMHPDDLHLTLAFLGATPDAAAALLWKDLDRHMRGFQPFTLCFDRVDGFGHPDHPRVLYLSPKPSESLTKLKYLTDAHIQANELHVSHKPFRPHVTIMKKWCGNETVFNKGYSLPVLLEEPVQVVMDHICLYRIHPGKTPSYEVMGTISGSR